jgi:hypothetical protein
MVVAVERVIAYIMLVEAEVRGVLSARESLRAVEDVESIYDDDNGGDE